MVRFISANVIVASAFLLLLTTNAQAAPLASESFDAYTVGGSLHNAAGGNGWVSAWTVNGARDAEVAIISGGLDYQAGEISISGGTQALQYVATEDGITNDLIARRAAGLGDTLYYSFLYQTQNLPAGTEPADPFMQIGLHPTKSNPGMSVYDSHQLFDPPRPMNWFIRAGGSDVGTGVASPDNQTHLIVMKATRGVESGVYDNLELFINPTSLNEAENTSFLNESSTGISSFDTASYFVVRKAFLNPGNTFTIDEVRIADTFADVVTTPTPDNRTRITTADGNGADSFVHWYSNVAGPDDQNQGGRYYAELKNAGTDDTLYRKAYFRFDTSTLAGADVSAATFDLACFGAEVSSDITFNVYGLNDGHANEGWGEGDGNNFNVVDDGDTSNDNWLTWNNAPGNAAQNGADPATTVLLGSFQGGLNGRHVGISGDELRDLINADTDGQVTLIVTRETHLEGFTSAAHQFASKEYGYGLEPSLLLELGTTTLMPGDADGNGVVNNADAEILAANWQTTTGATWPWAISTTTVG